MAAPEGSFGLSSQRVVAAYEGKQAEVQREAAGLRAALEHLQKEHRALVNQQVRACAALRVHACRNARNAGVQCEWCWQYWVGIPEGSPCKTDGSLPCPSLVSVFTAAHWPIRSGGNSVFGQGPERDSIVIWPPPLTLYCAHAAMLSACAQF